MQRREFLAKSWVAGVAAVGGVASLARAQSDVPPRQPNESWLAYQALTDTHFDAVSGTLTIRPTALAKVCPGKWPIITPMFWAIGEVSPEGKQLSFEVVKTFADDISISRILADGEVARVRVGSPEPGRQVEKVNLGTPGVLPLQTGVRFQITLK